MLIKTLKHRHSDLSNAKKQLEVLNDYKCESFETYLKKSGIDNLKSRKIEIIQLNLGKMCNQTCKHCHVDAGPDRKEIMTKETMQLCLDKLCETDIPIVDLTGGAPELNPDFRWFVKELKKLNRHIMDRCNLTIILSNKKFHDLPEFFANNNIEVVSSLPYYKQLNTDRQRGEGVFKTSINALRKLNKVGYGKEGTGLMLNLVYNPTGAFLPACQESLERDYKKGLSEKFGVVFNNLYTITNMPISRFLEYLIESGNYDYYMEKLINAFNPAAAKKVMCTNTISIGWDGALYDCDFNQMLEMRVNHTAPNHISNFDIRKLDDREIVIGKHCYGCTAGAGSSCGGVVV
jgi:radical SAM/Cys-rich protein